MALSKLCYYCYYLDAMLCATQMSLLKLKSLFFLFASQSVIFILEIKKDVRFNDESETNSNKYYQLLNNIIDNLLWSLWISYQLFIVQISRSMSAFFFNKQGSLLKILVSWRVRWWINISSYFKSFPNFFFFLTSRMFNEFLKLLL